MTAIESTIQSTTQSTIRAAWPTLATTAAVIVALVFAVAAISKLINRNRTAADFADLGLRLAGPLAVIVPVIELTLALSLMIRPRIGGFIALMTLAIFTGVLARAISHGSPISCSCFGAASRKPISGATLGRNVALMFLAAAAATQHGLTRPDLATLIAGSLLALIPMMLAQLLATRHRLGRLWSVELAGESQTATT